MPERLAILSELAAVLSHGASVARNDISFLKQGRAQKAWDQIQTVQLPFEVQLLDIIKTNTADAANALSPEKRALSTGHAQVARLLLDVTRDAASGLSDRLAYYRLLWALWVSIAALLANLVALVIRLLETWN